jgi:uncharacterized membrane protein YdjX (TVP38/TMEM64 family)
MKNNADHTTLRKRILGILILLVVLGLMALIAWKMAAPVLRLTKDPHSLRAYIDSRGPAGVLLFMLLVILQVFAAVVPGGPFQIAAGYAFGIIKGALICTAATAIGSILVFLLSRKFGMRFIRLFFSEEKIKSVKILKTEGTETLLIFLLFLIPGSPKDLLSYLVGLTDLPLRKWIPIVTIGRFPSILFSAMSGSALQSQRYVVFAVIMCLFGALTIAGTLWYRRRSGQ